MTNELTKTLQGTLDRLERLEGELHAAGLSTETVQGLHSTCVEILAEWQAETKTIPELDAMTIRFLQAINGYLDQYRFIKIVDGRIVPFNPGTLAA